MQRSDIQILAGFHPGVSNQDPNHPLMQNITQLKIIALKSAIILKLNLIKHNLSIHLQSKKSM